MEDNINKVMSENLPVVTLKGVSIRRGDHLLLTDFDLTVHEGDFIYITGCVGAGKSSILKSLYAEIPFAEGKAEVVGYDMMKIKRRHLPKLRRQIGIVFQDFQLLYNLTAEENLDIVLRAIGVSKKAERIKRIKEVLERVDMSNKGYKRPHELSGGEQQRIAIARALLGRPKLILADEPTGNLDQKTGFEITRLLHDAAQKDHAAVLMVTHNRALIDHFPAQELVIGCE